MKTLKVQFTRKPQFTPASLAERELSRIEWLVKAFFLRCYADGKGGRWEIGGYPLETGKEAAKSMTSKWFSPMWSFEAGLGRDGEFIDARKARHDQRIAWLANNPDAMKYFSTCWNYLLAVAKRNGEVSEPDHNQRGKYAMAAGYYG
jgi:hypothetical protein